MREQAAFEAFCKAEYQSVLRAALSYSGDRDLALDATQEAFARAFSRWGRLSRHPWAGGWVMTTALNICKKTLKAKAIHDTSGTFDRPDFNLVDEHNSEDLRLDLVDGLRHLTSRQRQAVLLYYMADLPVSAVADLMHTSEGTVKTHLSRARRTLRASLVVETPEVS